MFDGTNLTLISNQITRINSFWQNVVQTIPLAVSSTYPFDYIIPQQFYFSSRSLAITGFT